MNKNDFYYSDGTPYHGIFDEIPMSGQYTKDEQKSALYTIEYEDTHLPSARKIYLECVNEFEAASRLVPNWEFWKNMLKTCVKIRRVVEQWREEKYQMDQAEARRLLWEAAKKGNVSAQRILYEARKEEKEQQQRVKAQTEQLTRETEMLQDRLARITELKAIKK